jgi:CHAT domain-containing protein/tetratricopeptide (TPR) repeat protein
VLCALAAGLFTSPLQISDAEQSPRPPDNVATDQDFIDTPVALFEQAEKLRGDQRKRSSEEAIQKYRLSAELYRISGDLTRAAAAFRSAGEVHQILGDSRSALDCYGQALVLSRKAKSSLEEGRIRNDSSYAHFLQGDTQLAHAEALAALRIAQKLANSSLHAQALSNLGEAIYNLGDIATAEKYQQEALSLWTGLGDQSGRGLTLIALGYYSSLQAKPRPAISYFQQAVEAARSANNLRIEALALTGLANVTAKAGNKQEALAEYLRAEELVGLTGDRICAGSILAGIGFVYFSMGDPKGAQRYVERSVATFEAINASWGIAEAKLDLGRVQNSLHDDNKALQTLKEALQSFRSLGMSRMEGHTQREIGRVQQSMGDFDGALRTFRDVLSRLRSGQDQRYKAYTLSHIASVYESLNQEDRALEYYRAALPLSKAAADTAGESNALFNIARIERNRRQLLSAQEHVQSAIDIDESIRARVSSHDLRASFLASVREAYELYIDVLVQRHYANPDAGFDKEAFAVSERAHARSLLDSLQESTTNIREGADPRLLEREQSLRQALNEKAEQQVQAIARKDVGAVQSLTTEIQNLTAEYTKTHDQLRASSPKYAALALPQPVKLADAQQLLDDQTVLVEYALGDPRSYVWVASRNGSSVFQLASRTEIESAAIRLRNLYVDMQLVAGESVQQRETREAKANEALPVETECLTKLVLSPLAGTLGTKRLLIVPDGALQYIPFHALGDPDATAATTATLLAKHEIVYQPSASTLGAIVRETAERKVGSHTVAVFADPVFEVSDPRVKRAHTGATPESDESKNVRKALRDIGLSIDGVEIPRLLASRQEAEEIVSSAPWRSAMKAVGFEANRSRVLTGDLADYRIVHFATHGLINSEHPELSGIVLSLFDENGRSQDGFLRLHDIYNLHLRADLVVLSACSTGLGKDIRGEGLIGLTRGFMYAGASSVVASLWKVDDEATAELMKHFYAGMFTKQLTPAAALREAQLHMSRDKRWGAPYYWAGFVIQGRYDERVVFNDTRFFSPSRIVIGVGLLVVVTITSLFLLRRRRA